jgi:outer membrane receptor protein involved in Fe transport
LNFTLSDPHQIRVAASRTLARPEYRELSPILNRDVLGGQGFRGDTSLVRTLISNFDVRWEWYPNPGEMLSVALFAKHHDRPIEKVEVPTSGTSVLSFINAESAENFGVELEVRKELGNFAEFLNPLSVFGNLTLMTSEIRLGESAAASATNSNRPLAGQAPYIVNAGITYASNDSRASATVLYNRVGKRITAAGPNPLPDVYEMPRDVIDLSLRLPLFGSLGAKLDVKNLLDSPVEQRQGAVTRLRYTTGRVATLGLAWRR